MMPSISLKRRGPYIMKKEGKRENANEKSSLGIIATREPKKRKT